MSEDVLGPAADIWGSKSLEPWSCRLCQVMILCRTSKVRELLVEFLLAFGVDGYEAALRQIRPVAVVRGRVQWAFHQASSVRHTFPGDRQAAVL